MCVCVCVLVGYVERALSAVFLTSVKRSRCGGSVGSMCVCVWVCVVCVDVCERYLNVTMWRVSRINVCVCVWMCVCVYECVCVNVF